MKKWYVPALIICVLLGGCSKAVEKDETPKMLNVDLKVNPETSKPGDQVRFEANVSYGKEKVADADEVTYEIWRSQSENHEKIAAHNGKNGLYDLEKSFDDEGTYYVYVHVTARGMHAMPKKEFVVGTPSEPEKEGSGNQMLHGNHQESEEKEPTHGH
ncbi:FixH family protein [Bacillus sp. V5-8f]|uniref:FixH family protein n=1 Tax=Bacillus sp. V5-8f TaxID=2053044 RepID=UPI000C758B57|nr:FixH family protein [Bacillus sp. V5-8f]PLT34987.1 hypothetical protein CUU64_06240 [Bacillus sp. V5-8f]